MHVTSPLTEPFNASLALRQHGQEQIPNMMHNDLPTRPLGQTGVNVSVLGFGGGHFARKHLSESESVRLVQTAIDSGVSFMDNAWEYHQGESERRMGLALQGRRDRVTLMTKVCARDAKTALAQLEDSLRRLQTDVIDVWQFHEINYDNDPDWIFAAGGAIEAAEAARKAGKIRWIGFTGHKSPHILRKMLDQDFAWDTVQMPISVCDPFFRSFITQILPSLVARGIGCIGMKSLGGGAQFLESGLTPEQCRSFALNQPISTLVTGIESQENLEQDLQIARNFQPLTDQEVAQIETLAKTVAADGRHEWYKTTQYYDSQYHRDQHGFPPIDHVSGQ